MHHKGFTLLELVTVLILIGILSAIAIPAFHNIHTEARIKATFQEMKELQKAIMGDSEFRGYMQDVGALPTNLSDLYGAQAGGYNPFLQTGGSRGGYISDVDGDGNGVADILEDAWGHPYAWDSATGVLYSFGPNGSNDGGGGDDIVLDVDG